MMIYFKNISNVFFFQSLIILMIKYHFMSVKREICKDIYPSGSSGGDHVNIPITFGMTTSIPPHTPDLAGTPTLNANCPL